MGGKVAPISERRDPVNRTSSCVVLHRHDRCSSVTIVSRLRGAQAQSRGLGPCGNGHFSTSILGQGCPRFPQSVLSSDNLRLFLGNGATRMTRCQTTSFYWRRIRKSGAMPPCKVQYTCKTVEPK